MPLYIYKARMQDGKAVDGQMEAASKDALAKKLREQGYLPTRINESHGERSFAPAIKIFARVKTADMIMFNIQLANLIGAGVTLLVSLKTVGRVVNKSFKQIIEQINQRIAGGSSFSEALSESPSVFPKLFISMVKAGEAGGKLHLVLERYAHYAQEQEEIRQRVKNALFYPVILLFFGAVVVIYILSTVIPKFVDIFVKAGVSMPWPTKLLYGIGQLFKHHGLTTLLAVFLLGIVYLLIRQRQWGKNMLDNLELRLPVIGPLKHKIYISRFSRSLATLLDSGVSLLQSLDIICDIMGNNVLSGAVAQVKQRVESGEPLSKPLGASKTFPYDLVQMVTVGEESGRLSEMLNKSADLYDTYIGHAIKRLIVLIEPALIIIMAALVGLIMASVILPLFDMIKTTK